MRFSVAIRALWLSTLFALAAHAAGFAADSARGEQLFTSLSCIQCHSVNGSGGSIAPDLGRRVDRSFTPASLAATMWNHAPTMWASMREHQIAAGELSEQGAQDLMAFFYSARFFEKPGDAGRGKHAFDSLGCAGCHGIDQSPNPKAKPVSQWQALSDPLALVEDMWNHRADMLAAAGAKGRALPQLTPQDLTDMLVYLRNLPENRSKLGVFRLNVAAAETPAFQNDGCVNCHQSVQQLASRIQGQSLTEIAADMWNHATQMAAAGASTAALPPGDIQSLVGSLWAGKFFESAGDQKAGERVFRSKDCVVCHNDPSSGAPPLPAAGREFGGAAMVAALWKHGPAMLDRMKSKGVPWPRFDGTQMADLIAYLNTKNP